MTTTPISILLIAGNRLSPVALEEGIPPLLAQGATIELATRRKLETDLSDWPIKAYQIRPRVEVPGAKLSPSWVQSVWRGRVVRRLARRKDATVATSMLAMRDPDVVKGLWSADIVVALDTAAVYTLWKVAQERPDGDFVFGLTEALARTERLARGRVVDSESS